MTRVSSEARLYRAFLFSSQRGDPLTLLSIWGQLFLMDVTVAYATNMLFEKPGILLRCALNKNEDSASTSYGLSYNII